MALTNKQKQHLHTLKEAVITDVCNALATQNLNETNKKILRDIISEISYRECGTFEARKLEYIKKSLIARGIIQNNSTYAPFESSSFHQEEQPF